LNATWYKPEGPAAQASHLNSGRDFLIEQKPSTVLGDGFCFFEKADGFSRRNY
jgi:hypothetical protein